MNIKLRLFILKNCQLGEQKVYNHSHQKEYLFRIGRVLSFGLTPEGFPFIVWETTNFATIMLDDSLWQEKPKMKLRNDTDFNIVLNTTTQRMLTAKYMAKGE